jgi:hypothetical protein
MSMPTGVYTAGAQSSATGVIRDKPLPVIAITGPSSPAVEGGTLPFTFTRTGDLAQALTINYNIAGAAQPGIDFNGPFAGSVTFAAGSDTAQLNLATFVDTQSEGAESFIVSIAPSGPFPTYSLGQTSSATGIIEEITQGTVSDGYIANAVVFADANQDGRLQLHEKDFNDPQLDPLFSTLKASGTVSKSTSSEVWTTTDSAGSFVLMGGTGPLLALGGTDTATQLPFTGTLSAPEGYSVITPLTTIVRILAGDATDSTAVAAAEQQVVLAIGINLEGQSLSQLDPVAGTQAGNAAATSVFAAGTQVLNTVSLLGAAMAGSGVQAELAGTVLMGALATQIAGGTIDLTTTAGVVALLTLAAPTLDPALSTATAKVAAATNLLVEEQIVAAPSGTAILATVSATSIVAQSDAAEALKEAAQAVAIGDTSKLEATAAAYRGNV